MIPNFEIDRALSRRSLLQAAALGSAGAVLSSLPVAAASSRTGRMRSPVTPEEALQRLVEGNERFLAGETQDPRARER